ncbi:MAG: immunoglobulin domain-containing protein, partial [Methanocorpusculum sp.]|nr:immunoglobulin domain-containing protein [Methanocorpusculum sp.]
SRTKIIKGNIHEYFRKSQMKKSLLLFVIAAVIVACIFSPAASAAGAADGKEIHNRDYVLLGEKGLNFTAFTVGGYTDMAWYDAGSPSFQESFSLSNPTAVEIPETLTKLNQRYVPATFSPDTVNTDMYCIVVSPSECPVELTKESGSVVMNEAVTLTLKGKPGATYTVKVQGGSVLLDSYNMSRSEKNPTTTLQFTPSQTGTYKIIADDLNSDETAELTIAVGVQKQVVKILFNKLPADAVSGIFASGDSLTISGTIENAESSIPPISGVYLYITGMNLDANGVSLDDKEAVVDGVASTFTVADYDSEKHTWEYTWNTLGFEPGTYTIYAVLDTVGQLSALNTGITPGSQEIYISHPSIHVKFAEENGGLFTKGDYVYSYWSARGSPNKVRWYIIGPNFMETGLAENFPLYTDDQEPGKDAPQGLSGFTYNRFFSNDIAPGNYYLVYQHPGFNGKFDVNPNNENGYFTSLTTNFGESASLEGRPSSNCAEALETLINNVRCDDLCVITDITIEPPYISIDQVEHLEIGDALKIKGTTNYAGEGVTADGTEVKNTFSLKVNRLDFDLAEENAAMQLQIVNRVVPKNIIPYYGERTFEFDEIDTSTWFEGTYQATVTNIDTGFSESIMFTVGGEGFEADSSTLNVPSDPLAEPYEELEPLPPIERHEEPTEPEEPKSPGFILAPIALGLAVILRRK